MITYSQAIILFVLFVLTIIFDLRERRIPNWLTFSSMLAGVAYHAATGGLQGLIFSIQGLALGFALLILFYAAGGMGAGDVKLMGAVGSILGPMNVFIAFLYCAVIGGVYSVAVLYRHGALRLTLERSVCAPVDFLRTGHWLWAAAPAVRIVPRICYGIAISLGTGIYVLRSI